MTRSTLTRNEIHALAEKIYAIKKPDEFLQHGIWINNNWTRSWDDCGTTYSSWSGELMLHDGVTILEIEYIACNAVVISVNPLKYDFDVHVRGLAMQGMFDLPTVEKLSSWNGHERWMCGKWVILHGITTLEVRYEGMEIVRMQCDTIEQALKAREELFRHLPAATHDWMLYRALGFTNEQGIAANFQTPSQRYAKWLEWVKGL